VPPGFVPRGFANREAFEAFGDTLYRGFRRAGWTDVELYLRGSAVTGYRWRDGRPFDERGERSDLDIAVVSRELFERAERLGQVRNDRWSEPLKRKDLIPYNLEALQKNIAQGTNRDISFMFYRNTTSLTKRDQPYAKIEGTK
jgi:predicted nucleotidyltransferase